MFKEIERKFLVPDEVWEETLKRSGESYRIAQYYLSRKPEIRLRRVIYKDFCKHFISYKSKPAFKRLEIELPIPSAIFGVLQKFANRAVFKKVITESKQTQMYRVFNLRGDAYTILEIEFTSENEASYFKTIFEEVTGDTDYYCSTIAYK